jgi:hypothetical protein
MKQTNVKADDILFEAGLNGKNANSLVQDQTPNNSTSDPDRIKLFDTQVMSSSNLK